MVAKNQTNSRIVIRRCQAGNELSKIFMSPAQFIYSAAVASHSCTFLSPFNERITNDLIPGRMVDRLLTKFFFSFRPISYK